MNRPIRWYDYLTLNIYFLGLTTLSQTMTPLVIPLLVQQFVGEGLQGSFYGRARLWSLMVALLVQSLMGMLSDRSTSRWGRRRPFILIGTIASLVFITLIGLSAGLEGMTGFWFLFIMLLLLNVASNTAQGAVQGLIPDLVPEEQRGRFSGVKAVLEVPIPLILVAFTIGRLINAGNMWGGLLVAMGILTLCMLITLLVQEKALEAPPPFDWAPFLRLVLMTAVFTLIILGMGEGVKFIENLVASSARLISLLALGFTGVVAIALTVAVGVWLSVFISIGDTALKKPAFSWWVVSRLAYLVGSTNVASFAVYFLQGRLGYVREQAAGPASQLIMFVGLFILLFSVPSGWLADRFGRKPLLIGSGIVAALGTLILVLAPNLAVIYVGGILIGIATGFFFTANWALGTDLVPKEEAGRYLGISNLAGAGAGAVGAYIGGPIADFFTRNYPDAPGLGYVLLFCIYGFLFLFSAAVISRIKVEQRQIAMFFFNSDKVAKQVGEAYGGYCQGNLLKALSLVLQPEGGWESYRSTITAFHGDLFEKSLLGETPAAKTVAGWLNSNAMGIDASNLDSDVLSSLRSGQSLGYIPYVIGLGRLKQSHALKLHQALRSQDTVGYQGMVTLSKAVQPAKIALQLNLPAELSIRGKFCKGWSASTADLREAGLEG